MAHSEDASSLHRAARANDVEALRRFDITRKVAEMACLKGPRASVTAARLSKLLERDSDSEEDSDDYTAGSKVDTTRSKYTRLHHQGDIEN